MEEECYSESLSVYGQPVESGSKVENLCLLEEVVSRQNFISSMCFLSTESRGKYTLKRW